MVQPIETVENCKKQLKNVRGRKGVVDEWGITGSF